MSESQSRSENEAVLRRRALDELLVQELARGATYKQAGAAGRCSARTVARRMQEPAFRRRVVELRAARVSELVGRLLEAGSEAIEAILDECRNPERGADRLRAAGMLLTLGLRFRQTHELEERLRLVEERLGLVDPEPFGGDNGS
jgi:hypothetical protein